MKFLLNKNYFLALFLLALASCTEPIAKDYVPDITEEDIKQHIKTLASDEFLGRRPGTLGEERTVNYLANQLKSYGVEPGNNGSYFQNFTISRMKFEKSSDMIISVGSKKLTFLFRKDFYTKTSLQTSAPVVVKDAEIVFAGFGVVAPEYNWDDYKNLDVKDKVVLVLFSDPGFYTKDKKMFNGASLSRYGDFNYKKRLALEKGAKAVLMIHHDFINWDRIGQSQSNQYSRYFLKGDPSLVSDGLAFSGIISQPLMETLLKESGYATDYVKKALSKDFKGIPMKTKLSVTNSSSEEEGLETKNVVGYIKGSKRPNEYVIYTSHWDHVGTRPARFGKDSIFNGAIDNASGTAMHLEVAKALNKLKGKTERSILFIYTSAEEMGLLGAEYYAENPIFPLNKTVCVINSDGHFEANKMKTATSILKGFSSLDPHIDKALAKIGRDAMEDQSPAYMNIFRRSDHYPFVKKGVPAVWAMGNLNPERGGEEEQQKIADYMQHYHQVTDEYHDGFNAENITYDAKMSFLIGLELINSKDWPTWNEGIEFKAIREASRK